MFRDLDDLKLFISFMSEHIKTINSLDDALSKWYKFKDSIKTTIDNLKEENNEII